MQEPRLVWALLSVVPLARTDSPSLREQWSSLTTRSPERRLPRLPVLWPSLLGWRHMPRKNQERRPGIQHDKGNWWWIRWCLRRFRGGRLNWCLSRCFSGAGTEAARRSGNWFRTGGSRGWFEDFIRDGDGFESRRIGADRSRSSGLTVLDDR